MDLYWQRLVDLIEKILLHFGQKIQYNLQQIGNVSLSDGLQLQLQ
jgi:hypothetical protein